jgi:hypothetical protein
VPQDAIFLHSSWRAASTYIWAKFRRLPQAYCYFEPLNEHLATISKAFIDGFRPWEFANHPPLDAPYLDEFRALIGPNGGISGFPARLVFGRYCAECDASLPELEDYMDGLERMAARRGRRPVYGFVRTDMRVGWFRTRMPGVHIFIRREPRRQFLSMLRQATQGNSYFLERGLVILQHNKEDTLFAPLLSALNSPSSLSSSALHNLLRDGSTQEASLARIYLIFYFMRLCARERGEVYCDLVIDVDRLSFDESYRRDIEIRITELTGMSISLSDCRVQRYDQTLAWSGHFFDAMEHEISALFPATQTVDRGGHDGGVNNAHPCLASARAANA